MVELSDLSALPATPCSVQEAGRERPEIVEKSYDEGRASQSGCPTAGTEDVGCGGKPREDKECSSSCRTMQGLLTWSLWRSTAQGILT